MKRLLTKSFGNEDGATMVEFALVALLVLALIGVIFDLGVGIFRYSLMTHITTEAVRDHAIILGRDSGRPCATIEGEIENRLNDPAARVAYSARALGGLDLAQFRFDATLTAPPPPNLLPPAIVQIDAQHELQCFFCLFIGRINGQPLVLRTNSQTIIEGRGFTCAP